MIAERTDRSTGYGLACLYLRKSHELCAERLVMLDAVQKNLSSSIPHRYVLAPRRKVGTCDNPKWGG
jgi:hypothetical protein